MKYFLFTIIAVALMAGCSSKKNDNVVPPAPAPNAATLTFPDQNAVCVSGTVLSAAQSVIQFQWSNGANADSYTLVTRNLVTNDTLATPANTNSAGVTMARNTPFSWYVISRSSHTSATATSATWKFYNSGAGVTAYAPFPADNFSPGQGKSISVPANGAISLSWQGTSVDNDISNYDVYFGTTASPPLFKPAVTSTSLSGVQASAKTTYYWKIVTRDIHGNTSTSDIVTFSTQ